jgi:hypothetical protein
MLPEIVSGVKLSLHGGPRAVKSAVEAGNISDASLGGALAQYQTIANAFLETLRSASAFERMLPSMRQVPLRVRTAVTTIGATGNIVDAGKPTPISDLSLEGGQLDEVKAVAIVVATSELLKLANTDLFERELRGAVAATVDAKFISLITGGVTELDSSGTTAVDISADLAAAYAAVETGAQSRLFWLLSSSIAKSLATKTTTTGAPAFAGMTPSGGVLAGTTALVTDAAENQAILIDANGIAAGDDGIEIDTATQATVQMESTPDDPVAASTTMRSLWQHGSVGVRAVRFFGAQRLRNNSVCIINTSTSGWL